MDSTCIGWGKSWAKNTHDSPRLATPRSCRLVPKVSSRAHLVLNTPYVIANVLQYIPFYERLTCRLVAKCWDASRNFGTFWQHVDLRFYTLYRNPDLANNIKWSLKSIKSMDICLNQICGLLEVVDPLSFSRLQFSCSQRHSSVKSQNQCDVVALLKALPHLECLQISQYFMSDGTVRPRVHPAIASLPRVLGDGAKGLKSLIIDCRLSCAYLLQLKPFVKSVECLVISRIEGVILEDSNAIVEAGYVTCGLIAEVLEHIPPNQLKAVQFGTTLSTSSTKHGVIEIEKLNKNRKRRLEYARRLMGACESNFEAGDEIISILLENHAESLQYFIFEDIDLSLESYKNMHLFKNLKIYNVPVWTHLAHYFDV